MLILWRVLSIERMLLDKEFAVKQALLGELAAVIVERSIGLGRCRVAQVSSDLLRCAKGSQIEELRQRIGAVEVDVVGVVLDVPIHQSVSILIPLNPRLLKGSLCTRPELTEIVIVRQQAPIAVELNDAAELS